MSVNVAEAPKNHRRTAGASPPRGEAILRILPLCSSGQPHMPVVSLNTPLAHGLAHLSRPWRSVCSVTFLYQGGNVPGRQLLKSAGKNKVIIDVSVLFIHIFDALLAFTDRAPRVEVAE